MKPLYPYEPRHVPPIPVAGFALRLLAHASVALGLVAVSLLVGFGMVMSVHAHRKFMSS